MMVSTRVFTAVVILAAVSGFAWNASASEHVKWQEGQWRLELTGYQGINQGSLGRSSDHGVVGAIEYEVPLFQRFTFGLRAQPAFYYYDARQEEDIWGAAAGLTFRVYQKKDERRGIFGEVGLSALGTLDKFDRNSSSLNFITEAGVGYQFKSHVLVSLKWRHISNASLGSRNAGVNGVGVGIGYRF